MLIFPRDRYSDVGFSRNSFMLGVGPIQIPEEWPKVFEFTEELPPGWTHARSGNATMFDNPGAMVWAPANMFTNSDSLVTQPQTLVVGQSYTVSFWGTGSVAVSGGATATLNGTGIGNRVYTSFTPSSASCTFTVSGSVTNAQVERTSYNSPTAYNLTTSQEYYGPRFDYDPSTLLARGLLYEVNKTNMVFPSVPLAWNKNNLTLASVSGAPDGTASFVRATETAVNDIHNWYPPNNSTFVSGTSYTISIYLRAGTAYIIQLGMSAVAFGLNAYINVNLNTNSVVFTGSAVTAAGVIDIGNGIKRVYITATAISNTTAAAMFIAATNNNGSATRLPSYLGTGQYYDGWGVQVEAGSLTSYVPTYGAIATRAIDQLSLTIPNNITRIKYIFDDLTYQNITVSAGAYTVPTNLNRAWIRKMEFWKS